MKKLATIIMKSLVAVILLTTILPATVQARGIAANYYWRQTIYLNNGRDSCEYVLTGWINKRIGLSCKVHSEATGGLGTMVYLQVYGTFGGLPSSDWSPNPAIALGVDGPYDGNAYVYSFDQRRDLPIVYIIHVVFVAGWDAYIQSHNWIL